jgi:SAM-dependent methyltransferase
MREGFYQKYLSGTAILDIGFRGGDPEASPVTEHAIGIELDYPGYDGTHLPFENNSQDAVFASHTLEHIEDWKSVLQDWFRVLKIHGYLIIAVPHQWLYERKALLPSRFNGDHKRFYTPASLMQEVETALPRGCWRLRSLRDIDDGFSYDQSPDLHPTGCYEIEAVVEKIECPKYAEQMTVPYHASALIEFFAELIRHGLECELAGKVREIRELQEFLAALPLPGFTSLLQLLPMDTDRSRLKVFLAPIVARAPFDEPDYLARYPDVQQAVEKGHIERGKDHYVTNGYFEGRLVDPVPEIFR